jgi:hypothetical protein
VREGRKGGRGDKVPTRTPGEKGGCLLRTPIASTTKVYGLDDDNDDDDEVCK